MLKGLARLFVFAHPPQELETSYPEARVLAMLHRALQLFLLQGADRIEYQSQAKDAETNQDPVEQHQSLHDGDRVMLVFAIHVLSENPQAAQNVPADFRQ